MAGNAQTVIDLDNRAHERDGEKRHRDAERANFRRSRLHSFDGATRHQTKPDRQHGIGRHGLYFGGAVGRKAQDFGDSVVLTGSCH